MILIAKALSDPIRLQIMDLVAKGSQEEANSKRCCQKGMCVCDIQDALNMKQSKVSYHLKELKNAGLVHERKEGKWHYYSINKDTLKDFCQELNDCYFLRT
ncbi:metalloregulator ArsR/SmtB family transcription factor [Polycladomyces abyssicola]